MKHKVYPNPYPLPNKCEGKCVCTFVHLVGNPHNDCLMCGCMLKDHPPVTKEIIDNL